MFGTWCLGFCSFNWASRFNQRTGCYSYLVLQYIWYLMLGFLHIHTSLGRHVPSNVTYILVWYFKASMLGWFPVSRIIKSNQEGSPNVYISLLVWVNCFVNTFFILFISFILLPCWLFCDGQKKIGAVQKWQRYVNFTSSLHICEDVFCSFELKIDPFDGELAEILNSSWGARIWAKLNCLHFHHLPSTQYYWQ